MQYAPTTSLLPHQMVVVKTWEADLSYTSIHHIHHPHNIAESFKGRKWEIVVFRKKTFAVILSAHRNTLRVMHSVPKLHVPTSRVCIRVAAE